MSTRAELQAQLKVVIAMKNGSKPTGGKSYDQLEREHLSIRNSLKALDAADQKVAAQSTEQFVKGIPEKERATFTEARNAPWNSRLSDAQLLESLKDRGLISSKKHVKTAGELAIEHEEQRRKEATEFNNAIASSDEGANGSGGDE